MHFRIRSAATALALVFVFGAGCGKKDSPTQPGGGGTPAEPFESGVFSSGSSPNVFVHTFNTAGTYSYRCSIHGSSMSGTIHCATGMPESTTVNITDNAFTPSAAHVRPGGYIKWTASGGNHTVTRP